MMVIVTGDKGFIGSALMRRLAADGIDAVGCDRRMMQEVSTLAGTGLLEWMNPDAVVHLAAQTSVFNRDLRQIEEDNIRSFMGVVDYCNKCGCRLVYASSSCAVNITSMYGLTKRFDEEFAGIYADNAVGVRFHNVYGRNARKGTLLAELMRSCETGEVVKLYNRGKNRRRFTYIDDIVDGIVRQIGSGVRGVVNICNPCTNTVLEFVKEAERHIAVRYVLSDEIRVHDKEEQYVDESVSMDLEYTGIKKGLEKVFSRAAK